MSKFSLKKVSEYGDHDFIGHDECNYDSVEDYIWVSVLGGCGCGYSEHYGELAVKLIKYFGTEHMKRDYSFWKESEFETELMAHWLDSKELLEHGTSVGGSWLSDDGKELLKIIEATEVSHDTE